ncbi:F510_1955 family glycosylhydrolase [Antribacter gilvus]|uniref:F510_1955 family glycosylhydrolase n=1 Tax=Antribacter gilvus TaxID=2304675 RepID=UPI000F78CAC3|nr:hypothetical protein [Antribacter gilvus]
MNITDKRFRLAALTAGLLLLGSCSGSGDGGPAVDRPVDGFSHIHALASDPEGEAVLAATHAGVWRLPKPGVRTDDRGPSLVGAGLQDTMGMTASPDGGLYASGHPAPGDQPDLPAPNLGLLRSDDGAETWQSVSLLGQVDFHTLDAAPLGEGVRIVGLDSGTSTVLVSDDQGATWSAGATLGAIDLLMNRQEPDIILATTQDGLHVSDDAGSTFAPVIGAPSLLFVDPGPGGTLVGIDASGLVWTGSEVFDSWKRHGMAPGKPQAMAYLADDADGSAGWLLVAGEAGVSATSDLGATWEDVATTSH